MPLLFMDAGCELSSPCGSLSAEECSSSTSALEREGDATQPRPRVTKRREKNRDAARKSRRKQTERADELHEELQHLEQSNSALQKEIAALKKDLRLYEKALERHQPHCRLKDPGSSLGGCKAVCSPPQAPDSSSLNTTNTATGFMTLNRPKRTRLQSSASSPTLPTGPAAAASPAKLLVTSSSSSLTSPYSMSTHPAPHSLFCTPPLNTCASFITSTAAQVPSDKVHTSRSSSFSQDVFVRKLASCLSAPAVHSQSSHLGAQNTSLLKQSGPGNVPQFSLCRFSGNAPPPQTATPQTQSVPAPGSLGPPAAASFALMQSYDQQASPGPGSLLSLLTVPSPPTHCQTTSSGVNGALSQPASDPSKDLSLSELLELNEWILSGFGNS